MKFIKDYDIDKVTPADYNPRKINSGAFEKLKESLNKFGVCKAIIANQDGTIVAGHQRTKAMKAIGIKKVPIFILSSNVSLQDEIKFNLMHNSIETETCETFILNAKDLDYGYSVVDYKSIQIVKKGKGNYIKEICRLLTKYGEYGSIIIDELGNVIHNSDYAYCSKLLGKQLVVYKMRNQEAKEFLEYMKIDYGRYDYESLGIKPYVQTHCQMNRNGDSIKSTLYENYVIPNYKDKSKRLCDFGAGKMYYMNMLKNLGYDAHGYEPFFKSEGSEKLNISDVVGFIKDLNKDISRNGLYDIVVLDSVINSITSNDYQDWVLTTCNALLDENGTFYMGTRNKGILEKRENMEKTTDGVRYLEFLDNEDFSATFRKGVWTLQKFHTKESLEELLLNYFEDVTVIDKGKTQIWAICKKPRKLGFDKYKKALDEEFNLEYPNNYHHNQHEALVKTILDCH